MTRVIMHGCNGRMGQMITGIVENDPDVEIVAGVDVSDHIQNSYPVFKSISECDAQADVIIDFANASAVDVLLEYAAGRQIPDVLCTTGLSEAQLENMKQTSEKVAILKSANMSLGINTIMKLLKEITPLF
ncbi:MAG: 4-hydroxy-tetrahydrodipicolinate reductase, partial [Lachnospiraceae bacterium]|nr:4-hydroxy-tetrahydrodipicolinate reductase [Lachnospiraceae bacterium]